MPGSLGPGLLLEDASLEAAADRRVGREYQHQRQGKH